MRLECRRGRLRARVHIKFLAILLFLDARVQIPPRCALPPFAKGGFWVPSLAFV
jgi:hypothetical protein